MLEKDKGICIRAMDYSETSQILTFFTARHGKVSAIAKGSRRRGKSSSYSGPFELLACGEMVFIPRSSDQLATLNEFEQNFYTNAIRKNFTALNAALFVAELLNRFTIDYDPHELLYEEAVNFLKDVSQTNDKREILALLILFQLILFSQIGGELILTHCANCKCPYSPQWPYGFFSSSSHGLICPDCQNSFPDRMSLSKPVVDCFAQIKNVPRADMSTLAAMEEIIISHITNILNRPPKMANTILNL